MGEFPNKATQFKKGNPGCPVGHREVSPRRAGKLRKAVAIIEAIEQKPMTFAGTALQLLQSIYRDERLPMDVRGAAAKSALPYESPSIASVPAASLSAAADKAAPVEDARPTLGVFLAEFRREDDNPAALPPPAEVEAADEEAAEGDAPQPLPRAVADDVAIARARDAVPDRTARQRQPVQSEEAAEAIRDAWATAFAPRLTPTLHSDGV